MKAELITQEYLMGVAEYDPMTGIFTTRVNRKNEVIGEVIGHVTTNGYMRIFIDGRYYRAHRLAWLYMHGKFPDDQLDHINRIKSDNRIANLREATQCLNEQNKSAQANKESIFKGVTKNKNKWCARIRIEKGKRLYLGSFETEEDAYNAYYRAAKLHHKFNAVNYF